MLKGLLPYTAVAELTKELILRESGYLNALDEASYVVSNEEVDDHASGDDGSDPEISWNSVEEILEDLRTYVDCLNDLNSSIEAPIDDLDRVNEFGVLADRPVYQFYADLISARFPQADSTLASRLGEANWDRYQRICTQRCKDTQQQALSGVSGSKFHDSGLGTSLLYAATTVSMGTTSAGGSHSKLPPLSDDAKKGKPFICDACGKRVRIQRTREWK